MTHYDTLEVVRHASAETIRAAYRSLMQRHHPDRHGGDPAMAALAARLTAAYETLSDPARRAAYDEELSRQEQAAPPRASGEAVRHAHPDQTAMAAADALAMRRAAQRGAHGDVRTKGGGSARHGLWLSWVMGVIVAGALVLWWNSGARGVREAPDLAALRQAVEAPDTPEAKRRELLALKQAWLDREPELSRAARAEQVQDLAERSMPLLEAPLRVMVRGAEVVELEIPAITIVVGSFDAPDFMAHLARHRERIVRELADHLALENPALLTGAGGQRRLRSAVTASLLFSSGADAAQEYPSTWFESPGRHGVVDVLLPRGFVLSRVKLSF
ncbi:MAG: J domain-containing protein [Pseudomonadota bacterium]|nr:J domain-containing protein [Pseudomonadota bacterium]